MKLSPALSDFLNFPNLNLLMCGLVADCGNSAYIAGGGGQVKSLHVHRVPSSSPEFRCSGCHGPRVDGATAICR